MSGDNGKLGDLRRYICKVSTEDSLFEPALYAVYHNSRTSTQKYYYALLRNRIRPIPRLPPPLANTKTFNRLPTRAGSTPSLDPTPNSLTRPAGGAGLKQHQRGSEGISASQARSQNPDVKQRNPAAPVRPGVVTLVLLPPSSLSSRPSSSIICGSGVAPAVFP